MSEEDRLVYEVVLQYLASPLWTTPIQDFLDQNCVHFDRADENKFIYTTIHEQYLELIQRLLKNAFDDVGITEEQFNKAVRNVKALRSVGLRQILEFDDFMKFKAMMVKRNLQLGNNLLHQLQTQNLTVNSRRPQVSAPSSSKPFSSNVISVSPTSSVMTQQHLPERQVSTGRIQTATDSTTSGLQSRPPIPSTSTATTPCISSVPPSNRGQEHSGSHDASHGSTSGSRQGSRRESGRGTGLVALNMGLDDEEALLRAMELSKIDEQALQNELERQAKELAEAIEVSRRLDEERQKQENAIQSQVEQTSGSNVDRNVETKLEGREGNVDARNTQLTNTLSPLASVPKAHIPPSSSSSSVSCSTSSSLASSTSTTCSSSSSSTLSPDSPTSSPLSSPSSPSSSGPIDALSFLPPPISPEDLKKMLENLPPVKPSHPLPSSSSSSTRSNPSTSTFTSTTTPRSIHVPPISTSSTSLSSISPLSPPPSSFTRAPYTSTYTSQSRRNQPMSPSYQSSYLSTSPSSNASSSSSSSSSSTSSSSSSSGYKSRSVDEILREYRQSQADKASALRHKHLSDYRQTLDTSYTSSRPSVSTTPSSSSSPSSSLSPRYAAPLSEPTTRSSSSANQPSHNTSSSDNGNAMRAPLTQQEKGALRERLRRQGAEVFRSKYGE